MAEPSGTLELLKEKIKKKRKNKKKREKESGLRETYPACQAPQFFVGLDEPLVIGHVPLL